MVRFMLLLGMMWSGLGASGFDDDCLQCHKKTGVPLDMIYKRYILQYSSHTDVKNAMFRFLKNPTTQSSALPNGLLFRMGVKDKSSLSDTMLLARIDEYLRQYDIKKRIVNGKNE